MTTNNPKIQIHKKQFFTICQIRTISNLNLTTVFYCINKKVYALFSVDKIIKFVQHKQNGYATIKKIKFITLVFF